MSLAFTTKALGLADIHVAVLEGNFRKVKEILRRSPTKKNQQSAVEKTTPLHLAVIGGFIEIVVLLLAKRASFSIQDSQGRVPAKYARSSTRRQEKLRRYERLGFKISAVRARRNAKEVRKLFEEPEQLRSLLAKRDHPLSSSMIVHHGSRLTIVQKKLEVDVGSDLMKSTVGFIVGYGDLKPGMIAISGWKHTRPPAPGVLANAYITECVRVASRVMGFKLRKHYHDSPGQSFVSPEHEGRYLASHIEKQLAVGWVLKLLKEYLDTNDITQIARLKVLSLPPNRRKAKILIDHTVYCSSCLGFLTEVRRATGITFVLECIPFVIRATRDEKPQTGCSKCQCQCGQQPLPPVQGRALGALQDGDDAEAEAEELRREDFNELAGGQLMDVDVDDADLATESGFPMAENRINRDDGEVAQDLLERATRDQAARTPTRRGPIGTSKGSLKRTSAPNHWRVYHDKQRNIKYAKPIYPPEMTRPAKVWEPSRARSSRRTSSSGRRDSGPDHNLRVPPAGQTGSDPFVMGSTQRSDSCVIDLTQDSIHPAIPLTTIDGRSAFFESPLAETTSHRDEAQMPALVAQESNRPLHRRPRGRAAGSISVPRSRGTASGRTTASHSAAVSIPDPPPAASISPLLPNSPPRVPQDHSEPRRKKKKISIQESKNKLNLSRFKYNSNASSRSRQASVSLQELQVGPFDIPILKARASKRGAGRPTKDAQLRDKSIFARAFERHQQKQRLRQRQPSASAAAAPPPTSNPRSMIQQTDSSPPGSNRHHDREPSQPTPFLSNVGMTAPARVHPAYLAQMMSESRSGAF
ncbi:hypothetical protein B0T19DRAFT_459592 [Cercophora scortea]|uniref:Single-strand DNA deaminase toxin A-like C-terminal domain-containing protein n=1 Tax=Cercophora scortea TaxID=314031 RepID=A0AAE0IZ88_9PEZI|nr:hypothetical protein B0T19DRAFT_459592 [Cercophora scortea]